MNGFRAAAIKHMPALAMAAMMRSAQLALPNNSPKVPLPPYVLQMKRRERKRWAKRAERRAENLSNRAHRRDARQRNRAPDRFEEAREHINRMTNWQRSRWAREGRLIERAAFWASQQRREHAGRALV